MKEFFYSFATGMSDSRPNDGSGTILLGEDTINLHLDENRRLVNYKGSSDVFIRDDDPPNHIGTPPSGSDITRVISFRDSYGQQHIVWCQGDKIRKRHGNGYRDLYTLSGRNFEGLFFPYFYIHESKLIVLNVGDPTLCWDGLDAMEPLGVTEVPIPPDARKSKIPGSRLDCHMGPFLWANIWWPQSDVISGPSMNLDVDEEYIFGIYSYVVQFKDKYGNKGPVSPPSKMVHVNPTGVVEPTSGDPYNLHTYATVDWFPPLSNRHVHGYVLGRTANLHPDDPQGGPNAYNIFYTCYESVGPYPNRHTDLLSDASIMALGQIDTGIISTPQGEFGLSFRGRNIIVNDDIAYISDAGFFGQFRSTLSFKDRVVAALSIGDRLLFVTRSTSEVVWESEGGFGRLEDHNSSGSSHGRSFASSRGFAFGLFSDGWKVYDGQSWTSVEAPHYISSMYLDMGFSFYSSYIYKEWYVAVVRKEHIDSRIIIYDFKNKAWFFLEEDIYDITYDDRWLGCKESIYELFSGPPSESVLHIKDIVPPGSNELMIRSIESIKLLMEQSSRREATLEVRAVGREEQTVSRRMVLLNTMSTDKVIGQKYWNKNGLTYAQGVYWQSPGDVIIEAFSSKSTTSHAHDIRITFPGSFPISIRGIMIGWSEESRSK